MNTHLTHNSKHSSRASSLLIFKLYRNIFTFDSVTTGTNVGKIFPEFTNATREDEAFVAEGKCVIIYTDILIMTINSLDVCVVMKQRRNRGGSSGCRCRRFKETSLSEVAHDERHRHQSDADANRSE